MAAGLVGVQRHPRLATGRRRNGDKVKDGVRSLFENPADGIIKSLLIGHVLAVEADDDKGPPTGGAERRAGVDADAAAGAGHGDVEQAAAVNLAGFDPRRHQVEVGPLGHHVVSLTADVATDFREQTVDQHVGAIDFILKDRQLPMVLIDGAGYNSVTDFVVYVLRDLVGHARPEGGEIKQDEIEQTRQKLKNLGYL